MPLSSNCITAGTSSQSPVPFGNLDVPSGALIIVVLSSAVNFLGSLTSVFSGITGFTVVVEQDTNLWGSFTETPTIWALEGGGAKGAYQIGAWKALREAGIQEGDTVSMYDLEFDFVE